jgi:hypothetical protein
MSELKIRLKKGEDVLSQDHTALQVQLSGRPRIFITDIRWLFYRLFGTNDIDQTVIHTKKQVDALPFIDKLLKSGWEEMSRKRYHVIEEGVTKPSSVVLVHPNRFFVEIDIRHRSKIENSRNSENRLFQDLPIGEICYFESVIIYHADTSEHHDAIVNSITDLIKECTIEPSIDAKIGIISSDNGDYYVKSFSLEGKTPEFIHPDLHYGEGFFEFHKALLGRMEKTSKGLILLHGEPGTGKTRYIRVLLKELAKINKSILYAPPSLSASLTEPDVIEFISDWVIEQENDCILLIEDAEPLLEVRGGADGRSTGISNLLNMTDGLLNDILGLSVIATFNTPLHKIDPALLRPQRLLARKEFRKMPKEQLQKLADELNIPLPDIRYPATLAEFYSVKDESQILVHDIKEDAVIGFNRR